MKSKCKVKPKIKVKAKTRPKYKCEACQDIGVVFMITPNCWFSEPPYLELANCGHCYPYGRTPL